MYNTAYWKMIDCCSLQQFVYCAVRTESLNTIKLISSDAMVFHSVSDRPVTSQTRVQSRSQFI